VRGGNLGSGTPIIQFHARQATAVSLACTRCLGA
jgi:hypothetical protein